MRTAVERAFGVVIAFMGACVERSPHDHLGEALATPMASGAIDGAARSDSSAWETTGILVPERRVQIPALHTGLLRTDGLKVGDTVEAGAPLFRVEQVGIDEEITELRHGLTTSRKRLDRARELARFTAEGAATTEDLKGWLSELELSRARHEDALAQLDEDVAASEVAEAGARLESANRRKHRAAMFAPFAGTVTRLEFDDGEWVTQGAALATLESLESLRIRSAVPGSMLACVRIGSEVGWTFTQAKEQEGIGVVRWIAPRVDEVSGLLLVELEPDTPIHGLVGAEVVLQHWCESEKRKRAPDAE